MIVDVPIDLYAMWMARGLKLGTLLNEVLDEIRAEIKLISPKTYPFLNSTDNYVKEDDVLQIIDRYTKDGE